MNTRYLKVADVWCLEVCFVVPIPHCLLLFLFEIFIIATRYCTVLILIILILIVRQAQAEKVLEYAFKIMEISIL